MHSFQGVKYGFGRVTPNSFSGSTNSGASFVADANTLFNSNAKVHIDTRPTNSVSVRNIPCHIDTRRILGLFSNLIGEVQSYKEIGDVLYPKLDITFMDKDTAAKALCMNGFTVDGTPLSVSISANHPCHQRGNKALKDHRRNLYVLGLPFSLSKSEFAALFSQYGTVSHCVILATVDNSSRRRGFVVMSTHEEAKRAMASLTRSQMKGHAIDVSWAVVQRSQGFLDGGDRAMLLDSRSNVNSPSPTLFEKRQYSTTSNSSDLSAECLAADRSSLTTSFLPTTSLLVSNLPTLLFSQVSDLHPLFVPFGHIEKLEIVQVLPVGYMSVLVQYSEALVAQEAKESLHGQIYGDNQIEVRFLRPATPTLLASKQPPSTDDNQSVDNNARLPFTRTFTPASVSRVSSIDQERFVCGPCNAKLSSPSQNSFPGFSNLLSAEVTDANHSRQSSHHSTKHSSFSSIFDDLRNSAQNTANLGCPLQHYFLASTYTYSPYRWGINFGHAPGHQQQYPLSGSMSCHTVYQSSAA